MDSQSPDWRAIGAEPLAGLKMLRGLLERAASRKQIVRKNWRESPDSPETTSTFALRQLLMPA
ncbi:hypothetical protein [Rufibacter sp. XAAS-G3-1]|uniref:hypothetical protein n=1 Tax=Rufibacter sp. XAAS-G3-1 TaxID=2729134 RepID=UPI0015E6970B|nr:hypothetical protein [Rufibacter sp. XAAS-G3-1]